MQNRYLTEPILRIALSAHKMAFVSGPRQCGKTTLGRLLLRRYRSGRYFNWDDIEFRRAWAKNPKSIVPDGKKGAPPLIVLDEIHKAKGWKRSLKGVFDTLENPADILVTGSARLNVYKKGGDSLLGRFYHFRLHPLSLAEILKRSPPLPDELIKNLAEGIHSPSRTAVSNLDLLLRLGGFPQPFLERDEKKANLWRQNRVEAVIREDLRDLSRVPELSQIEMLASLLPERVGSPLSLNALREDLEVSYDTVKRWLTMLEDLYYVFRLRPYYRSIKRSLKKEAKLYLWDYSEIPDGGSRFENLVACHLLKACHYWTDTGEGRFELHFLRNKEKQEIDFLITRDGLPWLPIEVKSQKDDPAPAWKKFLPMLRCPLGIQLLLRPKSGIRKHELAGGDVLVAPASAFLAMLV
ncbi:MAG: ATP-binding protein [Deltaproteobacteria bacterium]|nr:ATP-binding protein [Deltaproteobacteria bacterium]